MRNTSIGESETTKRPGTDRALQQVEGRLVAPDLRRRDIRLKIVATSRFVEEFREPLSVTWSTVAGVDGRVLDLPANVDIESVRLLRDGRDLARSTDYRLVEDPRAPQDLTIALTPGTDEIGITVLGVEGSVLLESANATLIVPAAMRPLPPDVSFVVPAFSWRPRRQAGLHRTIGRDPDRTAAADLAREALVELG